jgi:hypothetical protein
MHDQCLERFDHVAVAQVPRGYLFEKHGAVILFGVLDQSRILLGIEEFMLRHTTIAPYVLRGPML